MNTRKQIRNHVFADKITFRRDGTVEFRRTYFYRHGMDQWKWAEEVADQLNWLGLELTLVDTDDTWQAWPKVSYFSATFRL